MGALYGLFFLFYEDFAAQTTIKKPGSSSKAAVDFHRT